MWSRPCVPALAVCSSDAEIADALIRNIVAEIGQCPSDPVTAQDRFS
jgi:hypothetical protein